jgi:hypothetical protein
MPAVAVTRQLGEGLALGDGLALGLGEGLGLAEGLGDGLGLPLWAFAPLMLNSAAPVMIAAFRKRFVVIKDTG